MPTKPKTPPKHKARPKASPISSAADSFASEVVIHLSDVIDGIGKLRAAEQRDALEILVNLHYVARRLARLVRSRRIVEIESR